MFDFSFGELVMIGGVALIVLGPERLPKVARSLGEWLGKAQRYVNEVKADFNRDFELAELKKLQKQVEESARTLEAAVQDNLHSIKSDLQQTADQTALGYTSGDAPMPDPAPPHPHHQRSWDDFIKPPPSTEELAERIEALQRLLNQQQTEPRFQYAPRSRLTRRLGAMQSDEESAAVRKSHYPRGRRATRTKRS